MKKIIATLALLFTLTATAGAMSYEQAREQALFLTDKMAYELNLTEEQYDAAYEVNLDYLMSVNTPDDLYDLYWRQRNLDLSYILLDWQYRAFCAATYFYRPLYWTAGVWHFAIYSRYPRRNYFYFGRPNIYITYRGGHSWRHNGGRSWYKGRTFHHGAGAKGHGLRDRNSTTAAAGGRTPAWATALYRAAATRIQARPTTNRKPTSKGPDTTSGGTAAARGTTGKAARAQRHAPTEALNRR